MQEMKWYVLKTISGQEAKVKTYVENEVLRSGYLKENLGQIVIPVERVFQIRNGKKIHKEKVYYPGYVMIEANLIGELIHMFKGIPGVISFLSSKKGGDPLPMRKSDVSRMFGKIDELSESEDVLNIKFDFGENVKVIDGPFNGFTGSIEKVNEEKKKLHVMVLIFGRKTPIELNYQQVEKI